MYLISVSHFSDGGYDKNEVALLGTLTEYIADWTKVNKVMTYWLQCYITYYYIHVQFV